MTKYWHPWCAPAASARSSTSQTPALSSSARSSFFLLYQPHDVSPTPPSLSRSAHSSSDLLIGQYCRREPRIVYLGRYGVRLSSFASWCS